jgi:hypothetical protein
MRVGCVHGGVISALLADGPILLQKLGRACDEHIPPIRARIAAAIASVRLDHLHNSRGHTARNIAPISANKRLPVTNHLLPASAALPREESRWRLHTNVVPSCVRELRWHAWLHGPLAPSPLAPQ